MTYTSTFLETEMINLAYFRVALISAEFLFVLITGIFKRERAVKGGLAWRLIKFLPGEIDFRDWTGIVTRSTFDRTVLQLHAFYVRLSALL